MEDNDGQKVFSFSIKKFVVFSVLIHLIFFTGIYFAPPAKEKKQRELITKLVTEEKKKAEVKKPRKKEPPFPKPKILPVPKITLPVRPLRPRPAPFVPRQEKSAPLPPPPALTRPFPVPSKDLPLVPGEVKDAGRPMPGKGYPRAGKEGGTGEANVENTKNAVESAKPGLPGRPDLFDTGVTEAIARKDFGRPGNKLKKDDAVTFDTAGYRYIGYMNKLRGRIESVWKYPPEAAEKGIYGDLRIKFTIKKDGSLGAVELERTSGYPVLDKAAMQALKDAEPYWPLPDDWGMDTYTIDGHFVYSLYGAYLR